MYADSHEVLDIGNYRPLTLSVATVAVRGVLVNRYLRWTSTIRMLGFEGSQCTGEAKYFAPKAPKAEPQSTRTSDRRPSRLSV